MVNGGIVDLAKFLNHLKWKEFPLVEEFMGCGSCGLLLLLKLELSVLLWEANGRGGFQEEERPWVVEFAGKATNFAGRWFCGLEEGDSPGAVTGEEKL